MTKNEFFEKLGNIRRKWKLDGDGSIRANCRHEGHKEEVCPITDVAKQVTGKLFSLYQYGAAAKALKLNMNVACNIIRAADGKDSKLRRRLLKTLRLVK
jgi:hypothetical protein